MRRNASIPDEQQGRPYELRPFLIHGLSLLDLIELLQLTPMCAGRLAPLRSLFGSALRGDEGTAGLEWWERRFLPAAADAFSCGFSDSEADAVDPALLPPDIRAAHVAGNRVVRQVWRLSSGYLRSAQKQREKPSRQVESCDLTVTKTPLKS